MAKIEPKPYVQQLLDELEQVRLGSVNVLERSEILDTDPNRGDSGGAVFIGFPKYGWGPSDDQLQTMRMDLLGRVRDFRTRFLLLFPHPTPEVAKRHTDALDLMETWLDRGSRDHSVPRDVASAVVLLNATVRVLAGARDLLPVDEFATRLVVDTNVMLDDPDLAQFTGTTWRPVHGACAAGRAAGAG